MLTRICARPYALAAGLVILGVSLSHDPLAIAKSVRSPESVCEWEQLCWSAMSDAEQRLWSELGWTQSNWDADTPDIDTASEPKGWDDLTEAEQSAATKLGYGEHNWEIVCPWDLLPALSHSKPHCAVSKLVE